MMRLIRNTTLYKQIAEIQQARSELRRSTHRHSLRMKKYAIRHRVYTEIAHLHAERMRLRRDAFHVLSSINALGNVLSARLRKLDHLKAQVEKHNEQMPPYLLRLRSDIAAALDNVDFDSDPNRNVPNISDEFHEIMSKRMQHMIPGGKESAAMRGLTSSALKDSIDKALKEQAEDSSEKVVFPQEQLVKSLVKELNLSEKELDDLLTQAGGGGENPERLRSFVLNALKEGNVELKK